MSAEKVYREERERIQTEIKKLQDQVDALTVLIGDKEDSHTGNKGYPNGGSIPVKIKYILHVYGPSSIRSIVERIMVFDNTTDDVNLKAKVEHSVNQYCSQASLKGEFKTTKEPGRKRLYRLNHLNK